MSCKSTSFAATTHNMRSGEQKLKRTRITVGVMAAATPHPKRLKIQRPTSIITKVKVPVAVEKSL